MAPSPPGRGCGGDRGEHVGELGADDQQTFGVGLGRGDLQQRDQLAGGRQRYWMRLWWLSSVSSSIGCRSGEELPRCPGPERPMLFEGQVAALAGAGVIGPDPAWWSCWPSPGRSICPAVVNCPARGGAPGCPELAARGVALRSTGRRPGWAGPATVPGCAGPCGTCAAAVLGVGQLRRADRAAGDPRSPPGRVLDRPLGEVEVEGSHREQVLRPSARRRLGDSDPSGRWPGALVIIRCFQAAATSGARRSEAMPGWWSSRSRQNSLPSA